MEWIIEPIMRSEPLKKKENQDRINQNQEQDRETVGEVT